MAESWLKDHVVLVNLLPIVFLFCSFRLSGVGFWLFALGGPSGVGLRWAEKWVHMAASHLFGCRGVVSELVPTQGPTQTDGQTEDRTLVVLVPEPVLESLCWLLPFRGPRVGLPGPLVLARRCWLWFRSMPIL